MKKIILAVLITMFSVSAQAQEVTTNTNILDVVHKMTAYIFAIGFLAAVLIGAYTSIICTPNYKEGDSIYDKNMGLIFKILACAVPIGIASFVIGIILY